MKTSGGVVPTERAKDLWAELEAPMAVVRSATYPTRFDPLSTTRTFKVAITESLTTRVVPTIAKQFAEAAPKARLHFVPHANLASIAALERGDVDCAVGMFPHPPATLRIKGLFSDNYICVFSRRHIRLEVPLTLEAFTSVRHVLVKQGLTEIGIIDDWLSLKGLKRDIAVIVNSGTDAIETVIGSKFVTAVPHSFILAHPNRKKVRIVPLPFDHPKLLYKLAWHERTEHDATQVWFRKFVEQIVRALEPPPALTL
jgi:DNA-binding transcriptional LysR family regulator